MTVHKKLTRYSQSLDASVTAPILVSNTFNYADAAGLDGGGRLIYARQSNPASYILEHAMMDMDGGVDALAFSSGMAAATTLFMALKEGENAVVPLNIYWPVRHWIERFSKHFRFTVSWVPDASASSILGAVTANTKLIWIEVLSNPLLTAADLPEIARGKPVHVALAVDATSVTPAICKPLTHGADIVMYSGSKCLGGHNDLMAGLLVTKEESDYWQTIGDLRWLCGNGLGAIDSAQLARSLMTLQVRMEKSSESALHIARALQNCPGVERVTYPGLESDASHPIAKELFHGGCYGPMIGLSVNTDIEGCKRICREVKLWNNSTGYGAVYSQIEHRLEAEYCISQSSSNYLRLSVGLEDPQRLVEDLESAIGAAVDADSVAA